MEQSKTRDFVDTLGRCLELMQPIAADELAFRGGECVYVVGLAAAKVEDAEAGMPVVLWRFRGLPGKSLTFEGKWKITRLGKRLAILTVAVPEGSENRRLFEQVPMSAEELALWRQALTALYSRLAVVV